MRLRGNRTRRTGALAAAQITVDVAVLSVTGDPVKGLSAADFEIYSDGRPVPITSCTPGPAPLNVVLLVDASGSMRWQMREEDVKDDVKDGFVPAVKIDRSGADRIDRLAELSQSRVHINPQELKRAADRALDGYRNFQSPSPVWDARLRRGRSTLERRRTTRDRPVVGRPGDGQQPQHGGSGANTPPGSEC